MAPTYRMMHRFVALCLLFSVTVTGHSQVNNTVVSYTFDNHRFEEDHHLTTVTPVGVNLVEDRFGNNRSAVSLNGHINSYLNLGVSPLHRPKKATISMWVNLNTYVPSGKGAGGNPLLLIKNGPGDDFYHAYSFFYSGPAKRFVAYSTKDSIVEASIMSVNPVKFGEWYHLAMILDDHSMTFYVNGKLQGKCRKPYEIQFLPTDSLMVGHTANKKNVRYSLGFFDDIRIHHRVLSEAEIDALYHAPNPNRTALILQEVLYWAGISAGIFLVSFVLVWQRRKKLKRSGEQLDLNRKLHEMEIRTLKAQMNPHFIFNALNSIQVFIMNRENDKAEIYLSKFSRLIRELLESNTNESLSVREETVILNGYLEIESLRFGQSFSYTVNVDERINSEETRIPHMMIQPFVENAVWHGLLAKDEDRRLEVTVDYDSQKTVRCTIDDNGVGRAASSKKEHTMKKKSLALSIVNQRLELMNELLGVDCKVAIIDKITETGSSAGTRVIVTLPVLLNH